MASYGINYGYVPAPYGLYAYFMGRRDSRLGVERGGDAGWRVRVERTGPRAEGAGGVCRVHTSTKSGTGSG